MKPRLVLILFIALCAATTLALTFIARQLTNPPHDSIPTITQRPAKLVERRATLPSGLEVSATYHFNRTALKAMAVGPECILALTDSANILRFERQDLRLTLERVPLSAGVTLAHVPQKGFFVGCTDGEVFQIDPLDLKLTRVGRLSGEPSWMGHYLDPKRKESILLAAVQRYGAPEKAHLTLYRINSYPPSSTEYELPRGIRIGLASAFFVDSRNQLWLGADQGEWGGWCARLDLNTNQLTGLGKYEGHTSEGVYGFVSLPDGQVWAYGGMMHLGFNRSFIARVDRGKFEEFEGIFRENSQWAPHFRDPDEKKKPPYTGPKYPITHIVPDPGGNGLLVFAYTDLFRTDFDLKEWTRLCELNLHYTWGRPDAMGTYPAIKTVQPLGGDSKDLLCATGLDGLLRISGREVTRHEVEGQIPDEGAEDFLPASDGAIMWASGPWRFDGERWRKLPFIPPLKLEDGLSWYAFRPLLDQDRNLVVVSETGTTPGVVAITRWKGQTPEIIVKSEKGKSSFFGLNQIFMTPDGQFWHTDFDNKLFHLNNDNWQVAGTVVKERPWDSRTVDSSKPPWMLLGSIKGRQCLFQLDPGHGEPNASLEAVPFPAELGSIWDAISWSGEKFLLVTESGLHLWDRATGKVGNAPFASPGKIHALCRDGFGRLWLAGEGLWIVDTAGVIHDLGPLSLPGPAWKVISDPKHDDGVVVGARGVLFIRAGKVIR